MQTGIIYRVVYSPTSHEYAATPDGVQVEWFDTYKQASRRFGNLPLGIVCGRWPGCRCAPDRCDYWITTGLVRVE